MAASILPPATTTAQAEVVLMYHDFYGPSQIWVNISHDGGATFGVPQEVLASPAVKPGVIAGTLVAQGYTFCNTVPAGVRIVPPGFPHAGRIFVAWIAADLAQSATGCNNLTLSPGSATRSTTQITSTPMHIGDICNLGIFCVAPSSNRNLLDFIQETLDAQGCAHIAYGDDNTVNKLRAANQSSGPCIVRH